MSLLEFCHVVFMIGNLKQIEEFEILSKYIAYYCLLIIQNGRIGIQVKNVKFTKIDLKQFPAEKESFSLGRMPVKYILEVDCYPKVELDRSISKI